MAKIKENDVNFSLLKGAKFAFQINGNLITFIASSWSGKETVTLNGLVVSKSRGFSKNTLHKFKHEGSDYEISYKTKSIMNGGWICALYKDGELLKAHNVAFEGGNKHVGIASIILGIIFGGLFAYYPNYVEYIAPLFIVVLFVLGKFKRTLKYNAESNT